jgi:hypothetical protein
MTRRGPVRVRVRVRGAIGVIGSALALAFVGGGCSLLVSGDVPEFQCAGSDPSACPRGLSCVSGRCVDFDGAVDPGETGAEDAPVEDVVDASKEADAPTGPFDLGTKCRVDADCKSRLCGSSTILTTTITQTTGPICTTPCCTSGGCSPGFVCFNGGTGGGYCVPAALAQRMPPVSGGKTPGATCAANTECRSGLCTGSPKRCLDTCCADSQCASGSVCRIKSVAAPAPTHDIWVCAAAEVGATKNAGDACSNAAAECKSDACINNICRPPCSGHASCVAIPGFASGHCRYTTVPDFFKFCPVTTPAGLANGATCTFDSDCMFDYCDPELKKCANVCATDSDCTTIETCRPSATGTPFLRCVPKP